MYQILGEFAIDLWYVSLPLKESILTTSLQHARLSISFLHTRQFKSVWAFHGKSFPWVKALTLQFVPCAIGERRRRTSWEGAFPPHGRRSLAPNTGRPYRGA